MGVTIKLAMAKRIKMALKVGISSRAIFKAGVVKPQMMCEAATARMPAVTLFINIFSLAKIAWLVAKKKFFPL